MFNKYFNGKSVVTLFACLVIVSCASTKMTDSWVDEREDKVFKHPMIIAISDSQQTRQIYEKHFVSELKKKDIVSTASYTLISSKQKLNREAVVNAIKGSEIDSVLVTYLVLADSKIKVHESPVNMGYSGNVDELKISDTLISSRGRSNTTEVVGLKNDLYDVASKKIVWSVQTKTVGPESIDQVVTEVTELLINQMFSDGFLE
ncbi:hypothetical protein MNBD_GAMMA05-546 [hydrothermal vent metagenome]|uniref:Lipoprotein n=1 Tax=hydrothermal vent metagenome TaxID=652676 RepID=A0A3B0WPY2_9ZZZZ